MMTKDRMLELMAYADGELTGAEREKVERWLATDEEAARFASDIANLGELVKLGYEARSEAKAVASFDIADAVMAAVEKERKEPKGADVVSIEAAREARACDRQPASSTSKDRRGLKIGGAVAAALALAASVFLVYRNTEEEAPIARAPTASQPPATTTEVSGDVEVEIEETPGRSVSVFYVPSETNLTTSVIVWVDESGGK